MTPDQQAEFDAAVGKLRSEFSNRVMAPKDPPKMAPWYKLAERPEPVAVKPQRKKRRRRDVKIVAPAERSVIAAADTEPAGCLVVNPANSRTVPLPK